MLSQIKFSIELVKNVIIVISTKMSKDIVIRQYPDQRNKFLAILFPGKHTTDIIRRIYFAIYQLTKLF